MAEKIKQYIEAVISILDNNDEPKAFYEWLLKEGKSYPVESLLVYSRMKETRYLEQRLLPKACYKNSSIVNERLELDYVEGFYLCEGIGIPLEHAFNQRRNQAWDFTSYKFEIKVEERFGVIIPRKALLAYRSYKFKTKMTCLQYYYTNFIKTKNYELGKSQSIASRRKTSKTTRVDRVLVS